MAMVKIFQNRQTGDVVLVPFALDRDLGGSSRATGPMETMSEEEFLSRGVETINRYLEEYYTRDFRIPSELYQEMEEKDQEQFFREHDPINVAVPKSRDRAKIVIGPELATSEQVPYPFQDDFPQYLLTIFCAMRH